MELESTPENVEYFPVANDSIPLGAEVYPLGYSSDQLKKMPIPARVVAKENSKQYYIEATCGSREWRFENPRTPISEDQYTISVENPSLPSEHPNYSLDESSGFVTKYSATTGIVEVLLFSMAKFMV
ncbi:hypothetical protein CXF74_14700 [Psychromonas sp. Urea-02u-13]|nr:hypothetical protein CXF74_14700 [Psychromonas sp. Urea-02u-13]